MDPAFQVAKTVEGEEQVLIPGDPEREMEAEPPRDRQFHCYIQLPKTSNFLGRNLN